MIEVLRQSLAADPSKTEVRLHLAQLLADRGDDAAALSEASTVLGLEPDNLAALRLASKTADQLGDSDRAAAYNRLLHALDPDQQEPNQSNAPMPAEAPEAPTQLAGVPSPEPAYAFDIPNTADELFADWSSSDAPTEPGLGELSMPDITLADIGGLDDVKRRLQLSFLAPMRNPELRAQFGKSLKGGLMLWGPPGCGKTFIARALAGELGASFYEVGLAEVLDMYIGASERNLRGIFDAARRNAPCLIFFDEIDALGQKRSQLRHGGGAMRGVVNQLLAELDGASSDNEGIFVLAASNHPWDIDPALLRPGRFDRSVLVLPPDIKAREAILALHLRDRPTAKLNLKSLAKSAKGLSGADLALACEQATEAAMEASLITGAIEPITQRQLAEAIDSIRPSISQWFDTAKNYALYGNESGAYDELAAYLKKRR